MGDSITIWKELQLVRKELREIKKELSENRALLRQLLTQGQENMSATSEKFEQVLTAIDNATNEVANDLTDLRNQIAGGLTKEEADALGPRFDAAVSKLQALGADPTNPVPENPETPETPETPNEV